MKKKLETFNTNSEEFLKTMEQLVSNDKSIRENSFPKIREYLKKSYENNLELYQKISRSLFYFYYNTDKSNYQLSMAKLISSLIYLEEKNKILIPNHELWINTFLSELEKKFESIDVLRLDKYIMLCDQVISNYLIACLENKFFSSIIYLIKNNNNNDINNYNFSFESNKIKIINRFIKVLFDINDEIKNKNEFINNKENGFINLYQNLLQFYLNIKDKREIDFFNKNIFEELLNIISKKKNSGELNNENNWNLLNNIIKESEIFVEKNKNILFKIKFNMIDFFINKIRDENYTKKEKIKNEIIDPVNDYIMNKKYKQKFRKSKTEIKKEKINKKEKEKKITKNNDKKTIKKNKKDYSNEIIDFNNIEFEKEIINLEKNEESEKQIENNESENKDKNKNNKDQNILNKKTKRNKNKIKI